MLFLLTDSTPKLKLEKIHGTVIILFYGSQSSPQLQRICFFIKDTQKAATPQEVTGGNLPNLVLKRIQFSKNSTTQENIRISRLKKNNGATKKKISNQKLNQ